VVIMLVFPFYVLLKFLAYSGWCYLGLRALHQQSSIGKGVGFGSVRLGLGMLFGVAIFVIGGSLHLSAPAHPWILYLLVYVPVRYFEWSIMAALLGVKGGELNRIGDGKTQRWILGGVVVSHLADIPLILQFSRTVDFLPVGRFLC
jgi:hypothetical protein